MILSFGHKVMSSSSEPQEVSSRKLPTVLKELKSDLETGPVLDNDGHVKFDIIIIYPKCKNCLKTIENFLVKDNDIYCPHCKECKDFIND